MKPTTAATNSCGFSSGGKCPQWAIVCRRERGMARWNARAIESGVMGIVLSPQEQRRVLQRCEPSVELLAGAAEGLEQALDRAAVTPLEMK
jgi:hypothetical protein